ncbi:hypothetical protein CHAB381_0869 [Campylobacter hominis ATCC BAA-381]|uniref:Uncharacterized protein n=1 Tax=Campylobacter hominis (strain ATCC BAA-381 / DSM 21671 / CCUG 45161 / LMG 19568 / NCTC 13146 / CH001A) TaxID=360107 RepID=A7I1P2_CAMHC|nr:hypothetical protein CHAB381_0869 [Campylobacter hominis ATCC BAA-381]
MILCLIKIIFLKRAKQFFNFVAEIFYQKYLNSKFLYKVE